MQWVESNLNGIKVWLNTDVWATDSYFFYVFYHVIILIFFKTNIVSKVKWWTAVLSRLAGARAKRGDFLNFLRRKIFVWHGSKNWTSQIGLSKLRKYIEFVFDIFQKKLSTLRAKYSQWKKVNTSFLQDWAHTILEFNLNLKDHCLIWMIYWLWQRFFGSFFLWLWLWWMTQ